MDAAVRLRPSAAGDNKALLSEEEALRREIANELGSQHSADHESRPLLPLNGRHTNGHSHGQQSAHSSGPTPQQRYSAKVSHFAAPSCSQSSRHCTVFQSDLQVRPAAVVAVQWVVLLVLAWLASLLLGLQALGYVDVLALHSSTSSWLTTLVPTSTASLFHALRASTPNNSMTESEPADTRPPPLCSLAHLKPIAARLYATTPIEHLPFLSLPNLSTAGIDPSTFRSSSTYNPIFPSQLYHNVCIRAGTSNVVRLFTGRDGLNATQKQRLWDDRREAQLSLSGEQGRTLWRHYWFDWKWEDEAEGGWRWLPGTTVIERKMSIYHDRAWNFGHMFADFIVPYTMHFINQQPLDNTTLTRLTHRIDRIIVHAGCVEPSSPYQPAPPLVNPFAPPVLSPLDNSTTPAVYPEATVDTVWPVQCPAAAPFHWMLRMMLQTYTGEGRTADGELRDEVWHGMKIAAMWNASESPAQCAEDHFDETVCYERLLIVGRQEDRDNTRAPEWENRRAFWVIRNVTMRTMGVGQPVHIAWNASQMDDAQRRGIRDVLARDAAVQSTVRGQMYTASVNRTTERPTQREVVKVAAASHESFVMPDTASTSLPPPLPRVLLYGRQDADRRLWSNVGATMQVLSRMPSISLTYLQSMHDLTLCEQMLLFSQHDVFIMPKGAALFGTLWAPPHSLVLELYPTPGVDWTWLRMIIEGMQLVHVRVDSDRRADCPGGPSTQRQGGQDDCFETDPAKVLTALESKGLDVRDGWSVLNMTASAAQQPAA